MPRMPRPQCSRAAQLIGMAPAKAARKKGPDLRCENFLYCYRGRAR